MVVGCGDLGWVSSCWIYCDCGCVDGDVVVLVGCEVVGICCCDGEVECFVCGGCV